jgi:hypothetical protein
MMKGKMGGRGDNIKWVVNSESVCTWVETIGQRVARDSSAMGRAAADAQAEVRAPLPAAGNAGNRTQISTQVKLV